ncbi:MAG: riboflavin kinase [Bacteroidales bacterium]
MRIYRSLESLEKEDFGIVASGAFYQMQKACLIDLLALFRDQDPAEVLVVNVLPEDELAPVLLSVDEVVSLLEKTGVKNLIHCSHGTFQRIAERHASLPSSTTRGLFLYCGLTLEGIDKSMFSCFMDNAFSNTLVFDWHQDLGYWYPLEGKVVHGNQIGRTLGFPTANLRPFESTKIIPPMGVYCGWVKVLHQWYKSMINIGIRPTLDLNNVTIEAHLFDFDADIYDQPIGICFANRIRSEMRFDSLELLRQQLYQDQTKALQWLNKTKANPNTDNFFPLDNH